MRQAIVSCQIFIATNYCALYSSEETFTVMGKEAVWQCCDERDVHLVIALPICQNVAYIELYSK